MYRKWGSPILQPLVYNKNYISDSGWFFLLLHVQSRCMHVFPHGKLDNSYMTLTCMYMAGVVCAAVERKMLHKSHEK